MNKDHKILYRNRQFICTPTEDTDSYIVGDVSVRTHSFISDGIKKRMKNIEGTLKLADCFKSITWDFSIYTYNDSESITIRNKEIRQIKAKIVKVRKNINDFLDTLEAAYDDLEPL